MVFGVAPCTSRKGPNVPVILKDDASSLLTLLSKNRIVFTLSVRRFADKKMLEFYEGSPNSLPACSMSLLFLCTITVTGRLVSRRISAAKFWWDDVLSIISLVQMVEIGAVCFC